MKSKKLKIMIATDYSDAVKQAERFAVQLAKSVNATLTMVYSYDVPLLPGSPVPTYEDKLMLSDIRKLETAKMAEHVRDLMKQNNIAYGELDVEYKLLRGTFPDTVNEEAKAAQTDVLLIGSHGKKGFLDNLFGNHAWKIMRSSDVPVLVIPKEAIFAGFKKIVYATEFKPDEMWVVKYLSSFASLFNAELTVLHITHTVYTTDEEKELEAQFNKEAMQLATSDRIKFARLKQDDISEGLERYCKEHGVDLLAMSHEKKDLFERIFSIEDNIIKKTTFHSKIPVLNIPDHEKTSEFSFWGTVKKEDYDIEYS